MLSLRRKEGQWVIVTDKMGNVLNIRVCDIGDKKVQLLFHDDNRNFEIKRPEANGD